MRAESPFVQFLKRLSLIVPITIALIVIPVAWHVYRQGPTGIADDIAVVSWWKVAAALAYLSVIAFFSFAIVEVLRQLGFDLNTLSDKDNRPDSLLMWTVKTFCAYMLGGLAATAFLVGLQLSKGTPLGVLIDRLSAMPFILLGLPALVLLAFFFELFERRSRSSN